jgi:hypothetical protein
VAKARAKYPRNKNKRKLNACCTVVVGDDATTYIKYRHGSSRRKKIFLRILVVCHIVT